MAHMCLVVVVGVSESECVAELLGRTAYRPAAVPTPTKHVWGSQGMGHSSDRNSGPGV